MSKRVQIKVYIDKNVQDALRGIIRQKYPESTYGALSQEVQCAIVSWINQHSGTITQKHANPTLPRTHVAAQQIIFSLKEIGFTTQCSYKDLRQAIEKTRGMDARTVHKWIRFLVRNKFIRQLRTYVYEIL